MNDITIRPPCTICVPCRRSLEGSPPPFPPLFRGDLSECKEWRLHVPYIKKSTHQVPGRFSKSKLAEDTSELFLYKPFTSIYYFLLEFVTHPQVLESQRLLFHNQIPKNNVPVDVEESKYLVYTNVLSGCSEFSTGGKSLPPGTSLTGTTYLTILKVLTPLIKQVKRTLSRSNKDNEVME